MFPALYRSSLIATVLVAVAVPAIGQSSIETIKKESAAKWSKLTTFSGTMRMKAEGSDGAVKMTSDLQGPIVVQRGEGGVKYSTRLSGSARLGPLGLIRIGMSMISVSDGEVVHDEQTMRGKVRVTITQDPEHLIACPGDGARTLAEAADRYTLEVLPEETLEAAAVYVVRGLRTNPGETKERYTIWKVAKDTGIVLTQTSFDADDEPLTEVSISNIVLNSTPAGDAFGYTLPAEAKVTRKLRTKDGTVDVP